MKTLAAVFGRRITVLRKQKNLTQEQLGRLVKIDYKYLGALERGEKTPSFEVIERIARALKADYYELFLTEKLSNGQLAQTLDAALQEIENLERPEVQSFFRDMLAAVKKLELQLSK